MASLRSHVKFECGKEPQFSCAICSRKFSIKSNCRRHEVLVHNYSLSLNSTDDLIDICVDGDLSTALF